MPSDVDAARVAWLTEYVFDGDGPLPVTGDRHLVAAVALVEKYGCWDDPVLTPGTVLEMVGIVLSAAAGVEVEG